VFAGGGAHGEEAGGIGEDLGDGCGEVVVFGDGAGFAIGDDEARAAVGGDDGGDTAGEGLEDDVAEGVSVRGEDEEVHVGVGAGEFRTAEDTGELGGGEFAAEEFFFCPVADDEEADGDSGGIEGALDARKQGDVLFDGEATDEAEDEG